MEQSSINVRAILIYGLIGLALLALIIVGISWAKDRSQQYATQNQDQTSQNGDQGGEDEQANGTDQQPVPGEGEGTTNEQTNDQVATDDSGQVASAAVTGPTQVPATGGVDWLVLAGLVGATYLGVRFAQTRIARLPR